MPKTNLEMTQLDGTKGASMELPAFFATTPKKEVLHQAVLAYLANARQGNAHTKTRGEVSGGGRKPWKQKGTGRARAGSSRSPLWEGGGITFGPRSNQNFSQRLPVKIKRLALSMALSSKVIDDKFIVIESLKVDAPKTKILVAILEKLAPNAGSILIVLAEPEAAVLRASRNLPYVSVTPVNELNTYDVLNFDTVILTQSAVTAAAEIFNPKK